VFVAYYGGIFLVKTVDVVLGNSQTHKLKVLAEALYPVLKNYRLPKLKILAETLY